MAEIISMPKFGLTMTEGNVINWMKKEGDHVTEGEPLFDVETDKITNEVEAPRAGYILKIMIEEGYEIPCGDPIAIIGEKDEDISHLTTDAVENSVDNETEKDKVNEEVVVEVEQNTKQQQGGYILATPKAKAFALENNIELSEVSGTGPNGIVTAKDISVERSPSISPTAKKWAEENNVDISQIKTDKRILLPDVIEANLMKGRLKEDFVEEPIPEAQPLSRMRKVISKRMSQSWTEVPHVTLNKEIDITATLEALKTLKSLGAEKELKVTFTHVLIKVIGDVLVKHPYLNAWFNEEEVTHVPTVNVGVATAVENGLIVPVIKNVKNKNLTQIIGILSRLVKAAKENQLESSDLESGTFTITNLGMFGIDDFTPIINQPQTGILGVGKIIDKPVFVGDEIEKRSFITFSLSIDHRVVDGAEGAKFLQDLELYLQQPYRLLMGDG